MGLERDVEGPCGWGDIRESCRVGNGQANMLGENIWGRRANEDRDTETGSWARLSKASVAGAVIRGKWLFERSPGVFCSRVAYLMHIQK